MPTGFKELLADKDLSFKNRIARGIGDVPPKLIAAIFAAGCDGNIHPIVGITVADLLKFLGSVLILLGYNFKETGD